MTDYLDLDDIVAIAQSAVAPTELAVRDFGLLESALARPQASAFGQDAYTDIWVKAAALLESLVRNHALIDGNKRLAWVATVTFLAMNEQWIVAPSVDLAEEFVLRAARGEIDVAAIAATLRDWSTSR